MVDFDNFQSEGVCECGVLIEKRTGTFAGFGLPLLCPDCAEKERTHTLLEHTLGIYNQARKALADAAKELRELGHAFEDDLDPDEIEALAMAYVRGRTLELPSDFKEAYVAGFEKAKEIYK